MKYLSLFTGIGGFELGIQQAYYFNIAKRYALENSPNKNKPNCSIIVKDGVIISKGSNGSEFHIKNGCKREGYPTGEGYELCEGCQPHNHSEQKALKNINGEGADLYLWGHWYCCDSCLKVINESGIDNVYIDQGNEETYKNISGNREQQEDSKIGRSENSFSSQGNKSSKSKKWRNDIDLRPIQHGVSERPETQYNTKNKLVQWKCVGYSEIDKYAIQVYEKHWGCITHTQQQEKGIGVKERQPSKCTNRCTNRFNSSVHKNYGDITAINVSELPDFEFLCGGFPCQAFSIAGKRGGFDDTRGTLFFDIARILKEKQPRLFLLENVKGLLSHDNGNTFKTIISTLNELGYDLQWQVLNSKNHGVPQNRERVFIIGHLRGTPRPKVFPFRVCNESDGTLGGKDKKVSVARTLRARDYKDGYQNLIKRVGHMKGFRRYNQTFDKSGITEALDTSGGGGHQPCVPEDMKIANTLTPDAYLARGKRKRVNGKAVLTSMHERRIRRLTPLECERLQGFPDGWTEGLSDTQRYKTLGNAVTVNVVREIVKRLFK